MIPVLLTKIKTRDGIWLDGIYISPPRKDKTCLIWIHGLTSTFYFSQTLIQEISSRCQKLGIGYFKFNTRGHDLVCRGQKEGLLLGTVFEKFEDCVYDIDAMIQSAGMQGYENIILAGHSTGANKALYYLYKTKKRNVKGLILLGSANDAVAEIQRIGEKEFEKTSRLAKNLYKKDSSSLFKSHGYLYSARRYLSLYTPGSREDVFPYYSPDTQWKELRSIKIPVAVIIGSHDECLDRPAKKFVSIFQKNATQAKSFSGIIIKGADHSFRKKEKELAGAIMHWIGKID
ncbi:MAG: hypothetical protein G01um101433_672 [Parcubacteria group bacterium Gr01-1014_33]|nr:MAG: hypothetical protein G01um101433_672 [Parcubacteria group bacterium Gr01-1014_33]